MKKVNRKEIEARNLDYQAMVQEGKWLEELESKGKSVEEIAVEARRFLNFGDDETLIADAEKQFIEYNLLTRSFLDLNNLTNRLEKGNIFTDEQISQLRALELELSDKVGEIYGLEDEKLYTEEV